MLLNPKSFAWILVSCQLSESYHSKFLLHCAENTCCTGIDAVLVESDGIVPGKMGPADDPDAFEKAERIRMYIDSNGSELAGIIADNIERNVTNFLAERYKDIWPSLDFSDLEDLKDPALRSAWDFADTFMDSASHGFKDMDTNSWDDVIPYAREVIAALRAGEPLPRWHTQSSSPNR